MAILKKFLKRISSIFKVVQSTEEEMLAFQKRNNFISYAPSNETVINPASGLPMIGGIDTNGNSFGGSGSSDDYHGWKNDYYHNQRSSNNYIETNYDYSGVTYIDYH